MEQWNNGTTAQVNLANEKVTLRQKVVVPVGRGPKFFNLIDLLALLRETFRQQGTRHLVKKAKATNQNSQAHFNTNHNNRKQANQLKQTTVAIANEK
jgi:hypothetical protein